MPNQLPKNQSQNSFNNEKHLNLLDNLPPIQASQNDRITNFILFISIFLSLAVSVVTYLNLTNSKKFTPTSETSENIEFIRSKETYIFEINKEVNYLNRYKSATNSIKIKQATFYEEMSNLITFLGKPSIETIEFNQENSIYKFKLVFFYRNQKIEENVKEFASKNNKFKNLKLDLIEKIDENNQFKITYIGEIDGR
jgi:hypothetical protein